MPGPCVFLTACVAMEFSVGLLASEIAVRQRSAKKPVVLTGIRTVGDKKYVTLWKNSPELAKLFAGVAACKRPLAKTSVFEKITAARNSKVRELMGALMDDAAANEVGGAEQLVPIADLGLDDEQEQGVMVAAGQPAMPRQKQRRISKSVKKQIPRAVQISIDVGGGGPVWEPVVLTDHAAKAVAIEATPDNFAMMQRLVCEERATGDVMRPRWGAGGSRPHPRGPPDRREYAVGKKWVTKVREGSKADFVGGSPPDRRPYAANPKVRTLKRFRTDETPTPTATPRKSKRKLRTHALCEAEARDGHTDCLDG